MKKISSEHFFRMLERKDVVYLENLHQHIAFKKVKKGNKVYCKCHNGKEHEIDMADEDYAECAFFPTLLTKEEYDNY